MSKSPYNAKHTPGPWGSVGNHIHGRIHTVSGEMVFPTIALVDTCTSRWEDNARLIASAPELLEALKDIVFFGTVQGERLAHARAAIAKAEGGDNV